MTALNISLPESLRAFVEQQVAQGGYSTASEYVRHLIRQEQKRAAKDHLEALLLEGIESGPSREMTAEDWDELKRRVWERDARSSPQ